MRNQRILVCILLASILNFSHLQAAEWFVATNGTASGTGSINSPWDITSAFAGKHKIAPGDTLWLKGGTYKYPPSLGSQGFKLTLAGTDKNPLHVRAVSGERVTLDGGLQVVESATHLWVQDLEILVSEPKPSKPLPPDPSYKNVNRPWGGLTASSGMGCKFINLVLHDNSQGASWWAGCKDSELYGCIMYDNGWPGTDRGHGHAIYTQNGEGTKTVADCIMTGGFGFSLHAYGSSRAFVDNYLVAGNICYDAGTFLIGGGRPSHGIQVYSNYLYHVSMQIGYSAPTNDDCVVRGNLIANGGLQVKKFGRATLQDNFILKSTETRPTNPRIVLRPNKYDPRRAHLAIFNWEKKPTVEIDLSSFAKAGDKIRFQDPRNFYGPPLYSATYEPPSLNVPMTGEFAAWVLLKD
jgi:hypothetical protein